MLCRELDLFGRELIAVDDTRIKAVNSRERNFTKAKLAKAVAESDERLARYLEQLDDADKDDEVQPGGWFSREASGEDCGDLREARTPQRHGEVLAKSGEDQISLTDPDARAMHSSSRIGVGYNVQIAVDAKHKLIAEQLVRLCCTNRLTVGLPLSPHRPIP